MMNMTKEMGITIDDVSNDIMNQKMDEKKIYGIFTEKDLDNLRTEFLCNRNPHQTTKRILTPIFQKYGIRCLSELNPDMSLNESIIKQDIQTAFYNVQKVVMVELKDEVTDEIEHMKGDPIRDEHGNPKMDPTNPQKFLTYRKTEYKKKKTYVPVYDSAKCFKLIDQLMDEVLVLPDFEDMKKKLLDESKLSYERGCEIIRELTNYYIFEDREKFVDRFALLICNAKAKGLGIHPKYPVMFSLVGDYNKGKGWFSTMIRRTYDSVFNTRSQKSSFQKLLGSRFNGVMMTRGFIALDEKIGADSTGCEELKTLITEPDVEIEQKHKEVRTVQNLVTFLSTTNEKIKGIMGLQKDRRIVEFVLKDKAKEIPEELMTKLLNELWEVMPAYHPHPDKIISELLNESEKVLDTTMEQIVSDLFLKHKVSMMSRLEFDFCRKGHWIKLPYLKNCIKDLKYGRHEAIMEWMESHNLFTKYDNGSCRLNKAMVSEFLERNFPEEFLPINNTIKEDM